MQARSTSEEEHGSPGKFSKGTEKELSSSVKKKHSTMWGTFSKARRSMICLPHPAAVCSSVRTRIVNPVAQVQPVSFREQVEFLDWLKDRGQEDAYQSTTVGISAHGRALFATRPIQSGERVLRVSHDLLITPDKLPKEVLDFLPKDVSEWARLALFLIAEQHRGQMSTWAPYISCLPPAGAIHSTVFWKKEEIELVRHSSLHRETAQRKAIIGAEFAAVQPTLQRLPHIFGEHVALEDFRHAYATVCSRAWGIEALQTLALVPFVDFFNHDSYCHALLSYDEDQGCAEVVADRDYAPGSQVVISYGRLPNSILALDFGFTLDDNPYDQVEIWMGISRRDELRKAKLQLLHSHDMPTYLNEDGSDSGGSGFTIREVRSPMGRGKGIPHSLRAFSRVVCAASSQEVLDMASEASDHDGRLCRRPLKNRNREAQAMSLLLARLESMMQQRHASLLAMRLVESCRLKGNPMSVHAHMAGAVISGGKLLEEFNLLWGVTITFEERAPSGWFTALVNDYARVFDSPSGAVQHGNTGECVIC